MRRCPGQAHAGVDDAFVRKYDAAGNSLWTRQFGTSAIDRASAAATDAQGGVTIVGTTHGLLTGTSPIGPPDAFLRRYDGAGTTLWTRQFGSPYSDDGLGVVVDGTAVYAVGSYGFRGEFDLDAGDAFIIKRDVASGALVWFQNSTLPSRDSATTVAIDGAGGIYEGGWALSRLPSQTGSGSAYVRKRDAAGNTQWIHQFGPGGFDIMYGLATAGVDVVYGAGRTTMAFAGQPFAGGVDAFAARISRGSSPSTFALTVTKAGAGTVTSSPTGINCGADCTESYASGTNVALTATASAGSAFAGWSGGCTGTANPCTVAMSAAKTVTATFKPNADLVAGMTESADPGKVGSNLTYTVTVVNLGPGAASGVTVRDALPAGLTFVSATPSQGTCSASGTPPTVTCPLGTMNSGASATIRIIVTPTTAAGSVTNTAAVSSSAVVDTVPANNSGRAVTTIIP